MSKIKEAINYLVASRLRQELPKKGDFKILPRSVVVWFKLNTRINSHKRRRVINKSYKLLHSIAQMKSVLEGPNREYLLEAYKKHRDTMSKVSQSTPIDILSEAYKKGQEFGERVNRFYQPHITVLPKSSASFKFKRSEGGKRSFLLKNNKMKDSSFRVEPTVLFLQGNPGVGKSRLVNEICRELSNLERSDFSQSVFFRNCNTSHWDGYTGQIITVLDDWAQDGSNKSDIVEIISLVTDNSYPLPMADLKEKGTVFTSKYLIICSNLDLKLRENFNYLNVNSWDNLQDNRALWRRFHHPYHLQCAKTNVVSFCPLEKFKKQFLLDETNRYRRLSLQEIDLRSNMETLVRQKFIFKISRDLFNDHNKRKFSIISTIPEIGKDYPWVQNAYYDDSQYYINNHKIDILDEISFEFPSCPPSGIPPVRTQVVSKALGSRMVTCAEDNTQVLKPFQVAMWKALGTYKKFQATHGKDLNLICKKIKIESEDQFILSGDYESATDNMNMDLSNALLNGILSKIDHEPTRLWSIYENGQHEVFYPPWTGLPSVVQTTGQLMGSLLSFPLLCLANDLLTDLAGIKTKMINGDDLLAICTMDQYQHWKDLGSLVGMKPSIGKNYISKSFGTFNSQLYLNNKFVPYTNLKFVYRKFTIDNCFQDAILCNISKNLLVRRNHKLLRNCPQSIDISIEYGGLGNKSTRKMTYLDKLCYFSKLLNKHNLKGNRSLPEGYIWLSIPTLEPIRAITHSSEFKTPEQLISEDKFRLKNSIMNYKDLKITKKIINRNPFLREKFYSEENFLPLGSFNFKIIPISKKSLRQHQEIILQRLFQSMS